MPEGRLELVSSPGSPGELWAVWTRPAKGDKPAKERRERVGPKSFVDGDAQRCANTSPRDYDACEVTFKFPSGARFVSELEFVLSPEERARRDAERAKEAKAKAVEDAAKAAAEAYANRMPRTTIERPSSGFINPYGFVPAPPRRREHELLGDHRPASHARYGDKLFSGVLRVKMTVKTPLLLRRHAETVPTDDTREFKHKVYEIRCTASGEPDVHPSGAKGMLSAAFEAATNSRMRIFDHDQPLTRRMQQSEAASTDLVAVRVTAANDGLLITEMERVRLPAYDPHTPPDPFPTHGSRMKFTSVHRRTGRVAQVVRPICTDLADAEEGWIVVTGKPPSATKEHEAIFVPMSGKRWEIEADQAEEITEKWRSAIDAYVAAATEPGGIRTVNAPHTSPSYGDLRKKLRDGGCVLCWAKIREGYVDHLVPTRFGRATYAASPRQALPDSIRPAQTLKELSPADRVFGWVDHEGTSAKGGTAHRGQLQIGAVRLTSSVETAIHALGERGLPLQALSSPKPAQALFYAAADAIGTPMPDGKVKRAWDTAYRDGASVAGRKVYSARTRKWTEAAAREPSGVQSTQNGTIRSWIEPGTEFEFDIRVTNLNPAEAGALMWLLSRESDHRLRLGGGRPLGFGEIHLTCTEAQLRTGAEMRDDLRDGRPAAPSDGEPLDAAHRERLVKTFLTAAQELSYDPTLAGDELPDHLAALLASMTGLGDAPVHYPRMRKGGDIFEWFSRNVQRQRGRDPAGIALPGLTEGLTLPDDPTLPG